MAEPSGGAKGKGGGVSIEPLLEKVVLFRGVAPAMRKVVAEEAEFRAFAARAVICREGDYTADFYVLLSGMVGIYKNTPELGAGKMKYLTSLPEGAWFGEMSCMSHAPRSATVVAEADSVALSIPRHTFMKIYGDRKSAEFKKTIDEVYRDRALHNHLSATALFRGLDDRLLRRLGRVAELIVVERGEVIASEGKPGDGIYLVRTGHAKVVRGSPGQEEVLAWHCENSFFGARSLFNDRPRDTSVVAVDRMDLVRIPSGLFLEMAGDFPELRRAILERVQVLFNDDSGVGPVAESRRRATEIGAGHEVMKAGDALVIDMSKCTRCNMCVTGCIEAHEDRIPRIGKRGIQYGDLLLTSSCYNCKVPDCMLACKFGAIVRDNGGQVHIDPDACTGCSLCEPACPYGTIHMQSLIDPAGMRTKAVTGGNPFAIVLRAVSGKAAASATAEAADEARDAAKKPEGRRKLRLAVKCDLCEGRSDMACIASCPCGAIERIHPSSLLLGR